MPDNNITTILKEGGKKLGVNIGDREVTLFLKYLQELKEWSQHINLTTIVGENEIATRHFLDSIAIAPLLEDCRSLLDIGSGAGFPGIPLKIVASHINVVLLDSVNKKVHFMKHVIRTLGLKDIEAVHGRAEAPDVIGRFMGAHDAVISRAFSELGKFLTLAAPYVKGGGKLIAIKGQQSAGELIKTSLPPDIEFTERRDISIPYSNFNTVLLVFRKLM